MTTITVNRAPVLTLWAAVVAEYLGFEEAEALTLGRALAGLTAHAKGVRLGLFEPTAADAAERRQRLAEGEALEVALLGRAIPVVATRDGLRATSKGKPIEPASVERYLEGKLGADLGRVREAMRELARGIPPAELGKLIAAALVGTFLGILLSYGFVAPLASLLEQKLHESTKMFQCMKVTLLASMNGYAPQVAVEFGRKVLYSTERPGFRELEDEVKSRKGK